MKFRPATMNYLVTCSVTLAFVMSHTAFSQGSLTPPGAPAPTMKSLDQVEARTIVNATNTPGDSSNVFVISQPGSYYLTGNVAGVASKNGIRINASGVTLDLNGFALNGISTSFAGIFCGGGVTRVTVLNGTIAGWPLDGVDAGLSINARFEKLLMSGNGNAATRAGLRTGQAAIVRDCVASSGTGHGFRVGDACVLDSCSAYTNTGSGFALSNNDNVTGCVAQSNGAHGFDGTHACALTNCTSDSNTGNGYNLTGEGCILEKCAARLNTGMGINTGDSAALTACTTRSNGGDNIRVGNHAVVTKCTAIASTGGHGINSSGHAVVSECTANSNNQHGINASQRSRVADCTADSNSQSGVHITFVGSVEHCICDGNAFCGILMDAGGFVDILNNNCSENGGTNAGAGIRVSNNGGCKVEGNNLVQNYRGIDVLTIRNVIVRNTSAGNSNADYNIVGGNSQGPIVNVVGVGDISGTANANTPMANLQY
jgi:hypothetical protein